jgi:4-amino-4-deoxy-L-arabinose transferase-like glycosyltransferase
MSNQDPVSETRAVEPSVQPSRFALTATEWTVLALVLIFYAATRLYGIEDFPIYFFCDEAHQANLAEDLVANDFHDEDGNFCPAYFRNVRVFNLGLSIWIHALPVTVFGKTVFMVRATSAAVGLVGVAALMLALKWFFGVRLWWAGGLVMAVLPIWFLHSRTAFETSMMVSFYAVFVLAYLFYREVSPWWLSAAVVAGAATFYSYSNGQGVMFITCLLLLVVDWRYHWKVAIRHRRAAVLALVVLVLVAVPYLRFRLVLHPEMMNLHLHDLESYWVGKGTTGEKIETFARTYLRGLSPTYWFTEDLEELERHRMLGYPHLPLWLAPAVVLGLLLSALGSRRSAAHRLVLIAVLAAPFSASLVGLRATRVLAMVVPATLAASLGLDQLRRWLGGFFSNRLMQIAVAVGLAGATVATTRDALVNGPLWFPDYGMQGLQWGASELFGQIRQRLASAPPDAMFAVSHTWANNADAFEEFFLGPDTSRQFAWLVIDDVLRQRRPEVRPSTVFVLTPSEYEQAATSPKLSVTPPHTVILDPAGRPAFYFVTLAYTSEADSIFAAERHERRQLIESTVIAGGETIKIRHPKFDMGEIADAFDGDVQSLARTLDGNPTDLALVFSEPRPVGGVRLHLWTDHYNVELRSTRSDGSIIAVRAQHMTGMPPEPFDVRYDEVIPDVIGLDLHIAKRGDVHIHMREIEILP